MNHLGKADDAVITIGNLQTLLANHLEVRMSGTHFGTSKNQLATAASRVIVLASPPPSEAAFLAL